MALIRSKIDYGSIILSSMNKSKLLKLNNPKTQYYETFLDVLNLHLLLLFTSNLD